MDSRRSSVARTPSVQGENDGTPRRSTKQVNALPQHSDSSQVKNLFNPIRGVRDEMLRNGITPRDHARDNIKAIREQSAKNKVRNQEPEANTKFRARPAPPRRTASQSAAVEALLAQHGDADAAERAALEAYYREQLQQQEDEEEAAAAAAAGGGYGGEEYDYDDEAGYAAAEAEYAAYEAAIAAAAAKAPPPPQPQPQPRVSKRSEYAPSEAPSSRRSQAQATPAVPGEIKKHTDYGRVPDYLKDRQAEMAAAADAKRREEEAASIPPGMRLVPEDERLQMLKHLEQSRADVERQLSQLSLTSTTLRAKKERQSIEDRLQEVEQGIKIFSRKVVWVHS